MSDETATPLDDAEVIKVIAAAYDATQWETIVDITDAWLESRGELPRPAAHFRAAALQGVGRFEEAVGWAEMAALTTTQPANPLDPAAVQYYASQIGLGQAYAVCGRTDESLRAYRKALRVPVLQPESLASKGHLRLAIKPKQWRKGWREHEARTLDRRTGKNRLDGVPEWDGKPTDGPVLILHEQGIGDAVLFARWFPLVAERSGHQPIWVGERMFHRYVEALGDIKACVAEEVLEQVGEGDEARLRLTQGVCYVRAMSLPHIFDCTPQNIPALIAPAFAREPLHAHRPLRVGVCWEGSKGAYHNFDRSLTLDTAALLWEKPLSNVEWVSLQYAVEPPANAPFTKMPEGDLLDTAERVASCDVVVTVDTSVLHVAGSLNIPTIVMPPMTVDWRYSGWPGGTSTLWYPSVLVVRRDNARETEAQVRTARAVLESLVASLPFA